MELFKEQYIHHKAMGHKPQAQGWQGAIQLLYDAPSITPQNEPRELERGGAERHAYWYDVGAGGGYCSACRYKSKDRGRYCQHCGARMDAKKGE